MKQNPLLRRPVLVWAAVSAFALGAPVLASTQTGPFVVSVTISPNPEAIEGTTSVTKSVGVLGYGTGTTDVALEGYATQPGSTGLEGFEDATSGDGNGVFGYSAGTTGSGVYGVGANAGGYGVFGDNTAGGVGIAGVSTSSYGIYGRTAAATSGAPAAGVAGFDTSGHATGVYGSSAGSYGVYGVATSGDGVSGLSTSGNGVLGSSSSGYGLYGISASSGSTLSAGVAGFDTSSKAATGVYGQSTDGNGVFGASTSGIGVYGKTTSDFGLQGVATNGTGVNGTSGSGVAVSGTTASGDAANFTSATGDGVLSIVQGGNGVGIAGTAEGSGDGVEGFADAAGYGVYGQSATSDGVHGYSGGTGYSAVYGDAPDGYGVLAEGNSDNDYPTLAVRDDATSPKGAYSMVVTVPNGTNNNDGLAYDVLELTNTGTLYTKGDVDSDASRVRDSRGKEHQMYAPRDTEAISEDFGEARLVAGRASVPLDPKFADVLGHRSSYIVFITPEGDTAGLYVAQKTGDGFIVAEHGGEHSSLAFGYRIVGRPANEAPKERMPLFVVPPLTSAPRAGSSPGLRPHRGLHPNASVKYAAVTRPMRPLHLQPILLAAPSQLRIPPMPYVYRPDKAATR